MHVLCCVVVRYCSHQCPYEVGSVGGYAAHIGHFHKTGKSQRIVWNDPPERLMEKISLRINRLEDEKRRKDAPAKKKPAADNRRSILRRKIRHPVKHFEQKIFLLEILDWVANFSRLTGWQIFLLNMLDWVAKFARNFTGNSNPVSVLGFDSIEGRITTQKLPRNSPRKYDG